MHYFSRTHTHTRITRRTRIIIVINYRWRRNNDGDNNNDINVSACLRPTTDRTLCKKKFLTAPPADTRAFYNVSARTFVTRRLWEN